MFPSSPEIQPLLKMPALCLSGIRPSVRRWVRSQPLKLQIRKRAANRDTGETKLERAEQKDDKAGGCNFKEKEEKPVKMHVVGPAGTGTGTGSGLGSGSGSRSGSGSGRKIMVVVDRSVEAKVAVQWVLTHTLQSDDTLVLLHPVKLKLKLSNKQGIGDKGTNRKKPGVYELLHSVKKLCHNKRPEVQVEVCVVQGKEKGPAIVEEARKQRVSLLVLGQKKKASTTWRLLAMWTGGVNITSAGSSAFGAGGRSGGRIGMTEHCIQNADCMAIAVRRKSKKLGGYLITTKKQRDFWLLA